jgi:hypothetical protein
MQITVWQGGRHTVDNSMSDSIAHLIVALQRNIRSSSPLRLGTVNDITWKANLDVEEGHIHINCMMGVVNLVGIEPNNK